MERTVKKPIWASRQRKFPEKSKEAADRLSLDHRSDLTKQQGKPERLTSPA